MKPYLRLVAIAGALILLISACQPVVDTSLDELVDIGSHRLHLYCTGAGSPTVVIDTGIGETYTSWDDVIAELSETTKVCAYERAGYGQSEMGPLPRDSQRAASELHSLLTQAGVAGPYVLVGHSLGALNMQVFAAGYPEDVVGAVLLDPSPLGWIVGDGFPELRDLFMQETSKMRALADAARNSSDPADVTQAYFAEALASEFEQFFGNTADQVAAIKTFGDLPLTVIGATEPEPGFGEFAPAFRQFWNEESQILAAKSTEGQFVIAEGSSHHIHLDAPDVVVEEIRQIVQKARELA